MKEPTHDSEPVANKSIDDLESDWLARMMKRPLEVDYFIDLSSRLAQTPHRARGITLLELLNDQLQEEMLWEVRLELLHGAGRLLFDPPTLHQEILSSLRKIYPGSPSLGGLIDKVGLMRAIEDLPKVWEKVDRLRQLMRFDVGTPVWMEGKGAGRVEEVNLELESFKLDLERHPGLRVGFRVAHKLLVPLDESHILRRKLDNPEELVELKTRAPGELLVLLLQSYDSPRTAAEIRKTLFGIVNDEEWAAWWSAARNDPRVVNQGSGARQTYSSTLTSDGALESVRRAFAAADLAGKLEIFRKNTDRHAGLTTSMSSELFSLASDVRADDPGLAILIWIVLEKAGTVGRVTEWSPESLIRESQDPSALIASIAERPIRERLYLSAMRERSDGQAVLRSCFEVEEDPRLLSFLADILRGEDLKSFKSALDDLLSQPRRRPSGFVWLLENAGETSLVDGRNSLRLLQQICDSLHQVEFAKLRNRVLKAIETGGLAAQLFEGLTEDQAAQAELTIRRAPLGEHLESMLIEALHHRFAFLDDNRQAPLYATSAAIEARKAELKLLMENEIPANRKAIGEARALGDLRENFEYKAARQRHEYLTARVESLHRDLRRVQPFDPVLKDLSEVRLGARLELRRADGEIRNLTVLGPWESDPERGIVSYDSDFGRTLLGKKIGESIELDGESFDLTRISSYT